MVERARGYAKVVTGGRAPDGDLARGCYYEPTLVTDVPPDSELWRDEVFGPVLAVVAFDDDDEAIRLANDTRSASPRRPGRATPTAPAAPPVRSGPAACGSTTTSRSSARCPTAGTGSGFGKDMSAYSFDEYTNVKHVMHDNTAVAHKPWHRTIFTDR